MPGCFSPIYRDDMVLLDGGVVWRNDMHDAVQRCRDLGHEDKDIIVDWIMCAENHYSEKSNLEEWHTLKHAMRAYELHDYYGTTAEVERTKIFFPDVELRYVIGPSESLSSPLIPLDFSREHLDTCIAIGEKDAVNAVNLGPGGYEKILMDHFHEQEAGSVGDFQARLKQALHAKGLTPAE